MVKNKKIESESIIMTDLHLKNPYKLYTAWRCYKLGVENEKRK